MKKGLDDFLDTPNLSQRSAAASLFRRERSTLNAFLTIASTSANLLGLLLTNTNRG